MNHLQIKRFKQAKSERKAGRLQRALEIFSKLHKELPKSVEIRTELGLTHYNFGQIQEAAEIFQKLHEERPEDVHILNCCGIAYMQLGMFDLAIQFFKKYVGKKNDDYEAWVNLCCAAGKNNQMTDAAFYAMQALSLKPLDSKAHQNMGSVMLALGRPNDALISFQTALDLDPDNIAARSNIGNIFGELNQPENALEIYNDCLAQNAPDSLMHSDLKYRMSFEYLKLGRLDKAWDHYDHGFVLTDTQSRTPKRKFGVPQWRGEPIAGKKLMVWREQGLGDELMFMPTIRELISRDIDVIIECDPRLVTTLQRSFPECLVRTQAFFSPPNGMPVIQDYDFHIPLGSLLGLYRRDIESFDKAQPYLVADPTKIAAFEKRIGSTKQKIGICWRSGTLNAQRNQHYAPLSSFGSIFELHEAYEFVNLQYGDCEQELLAAQDLFGVHIHRWDDVDLMNDLDSVAALIDSLDHVVSAGTAVAQMTMALGKPLSLYLPSGNPWVLLGQSHYPWYPNNPVQLYRPKPGVSVESVIPEIAYNLSNALAT
jgi:tetratricopeptide (TPR) repeat protein